VNLPALYQTETGLPQVMVKGGASYGHGEEHISVRFLLAMLCRRREALLLTLAICLGLTAIWTTALPRIYRSSADVVMITKSTELVPDRAEEAQEGPTRAEDLETQI